MGVKCPQKGRNLQIKCSFWAMPPQEDLRDGPT